MYIVVKQWLVGSKMNVRIVRCIYCRKHQIDKGVYQKIQGCCSNILIDPQLFLELKNADPS